ncbi:LmeA family phospholipid-binding protein [Actinokineospora sp.]|uniref:LmeA family phospholipid-binding protein n=1 Tax=Actinokineospora sp. TaxID=1872133 RepID=UPI004037AAC0
MTTVTNSGRPQAAPRRRRSKTVRRLVITLVVLLGLLVAADFGAAAVFEHEVSKRAQAQFDLRDHPSVKVGGFSFLVQAFSGEYDLVTVDAKGVPVRDTLRDVDVHADLRGVRAPLSDLVSGSLTGVPVREVEGQVRVKAADVNRAIQRNENEVVSALTNLTVDPASEKTVATAPAEGAETEQEDEIADQEGSTAGVRLCGTADIAGQSTELCVFSIISLVEGKIVVSPKRLELRNGATSAALPAALQAKVLPLFAITLDPGTLPFKVTPTAVTVEPGLLMVKGKATDLVLGR